MNSEHPKFVMFGSTDPHYEPILSDLYRDQPFTEIELIHKTQFPSQSFFTKKFASQITKSSEINELTSRIIKSLNKISQTHVFDQANVDMALENSKLTVNLSVFEKKRYDCNLKWKPSGKNGVFLDTKLFFLWRTPFGVMDSHKFELIQGILDKHSRKGYRWVSDFPFIPNPDTTIRVSVSQRQKYIDRNIEENSFSEKIRLRPFEKHWNASIKHKYLQNHLNIPENSQYCLDHQIFPSDEYSLKLQKTFIDNIDKGIVHTGQRLEAGLKLGINDTYQKYLNFGVKHKKYFRLFDPQTQERPFLRYINLENQFRAGVYLPLDSKPCLINNLLNLNDNIPGFFSLGGRYEPVIAGNPNEDYKGDYKGNSYFLANTLKVNFYDYPIVKLLGFVPFGHLTGVLSGDRFKGANVRENLRFSAGIGMRFSLFGVEDMHILYNIGHFGNGKDSMAARFQILIC